MRLIALVTLTGIVTTSTAGEPILLDHFDDGVLGDEWLMTFDRANGWTFEESGSELTVTGIDATVPLEWGKVVLQQQVPLTHDFELAFDFSWESPPTAMQHLFLTLEAADGSEVVRVGYRDPWLGSLGGQQACVAGDCSTSPFGSLPAMGSAEVRITRAIGTTLIHWDDELIRFGTDFTAVRTLKLDFRYFPQDPSVFGTEAVDRVELTGDSGCPDYDGDQAVGFDDLVFVLESWSNGLVPDCPPYPAGDIDLDCEVGFADLAALLAAWGAC